MLRPVLSPSEVEPILEAGRKAGAETEIYATRRETLSIVLHGTRLRDVEVSSALGLGIRVLRQGRVAFLFAGDPARGLEQIRRSLASPPAGPPVAFPLPQGVTAPDPPLVDPDLDRAAPEELAAIARAAVRRLRGRAPRVRRVSAGITRQRMRVALFNSRGLEAAYGKALLGAGFEIAGEGRGRSARRLRTTRSGCRMDRGLDGLLDDLETRLRLLDLPVRAPGTPDVVVLHPAAARDLLGSLKIWTNGWYHAKGLSPLAGRLDEQVLDARVSVSDDPTLPFGAGSLPFDGEGIAAARTRVVENGVLRQVVTDLRTGAALGRPSTGNGIRSYDSPPMPGYTNFVLHGGTRPWPEILEGLDRAVVVYGFAQGIKVQPVRGDYAMRAGLAVRIERGVPTGRIENLPFSGNLRRDLSLHLLELSRDPLVLGHERIPYICMKNDHVR